MTLAKRIANWASNLFVSGVVIVAALTFGMQTVQWWRADSSGLNERTGIDNVLGPGALASEDASHLLEFGDFPYVFNRLIVTGDSQEALSGLRRHCRQAALRAAVLDESPFPAEQKALANLAGKKPVAEEPGRWQMYENPLPLPMVVVVTPGTIGSTPPPALGPDDEQEQNVVAAKRRVLSWGLAFPRGAEGKGNVPAWTLFVWSPGADAAIADVSPFVPPPGSKRTMTMRSEEGAAVVAFCGEGTLVAWRDFVNDWARRNGWHAVGEWSSLGGAWCLRLENKEKGTIEVQMSANKEMKLLGLATVTPPTSPKEK